MLKSHSGSHDFTDHCHQCVATTARCTNWLTINTVSNATVTIKLSASNLQTVISHNQAPGQILSRFRAPQRRQHELS